MRIVLVPFLLGVAALERMTRERGAWPARDDPTKPWNRAAELKRTFRAELRVG